MMSTGYEQPGDPNFEGGAAFERFQEFQERIRASERQIAESDLYFRANRWEQER